MLLTDFISPMALTDKKYAELCYTFKPHLELKPIVTAERCYFHLRNQGLNESVAEYIMELQRLALHCEFGKFIL